MKFHMTDLTAPYAHMESLPNCRVELSSQNIFSKEKGKLDERENLRDMIQKFGQMLKKQETLCIVEKQSFDIRFEIFAFVLFIS